MTSTARPNPTTSRTSTIDSSTSSKSPTSRSTASANAAHPAPYVQGPFQPLGREVDLDTFATAGDLPPELDGWLYRIGPDLIGDPSPQCHWFIADGMVHGMEFRDSRPRRYRNRWVRSGPTAAKLGAPAPAGPAPANDKYDQANTDMLTFAGQLLATTETCLPYRLTGDLDTIGRVDFGASPALVGGFGTHPKIDPRTGDLHTVTYRWDQAPHLLYHHIGADGRWISTTGIDVPACTLVHDTAITEQFIILFDLPARWDYRLQDRGYDVPVVWDRDYQARIGVMALGGGPVTWFDVDPCFIFHTYNAYEIPSPTGGAPNVVLDAVRHVEAFADNTEMPSSPYPSIPTRWHLDLSTGKATETLLDDPRGSTGIEFPQIDQRRLGSTYRHGYAAGFPGRDGAASFTKLDLETGNHTRHSFGPGTWASEPLFVPAHDGIGDDEGWLIGTVHHAATDTSDVIVIDAHDLTERARVHLPHRIPAGFHGAWVPRSTHDRL